MNIWCRTCRAAFDADTADEAYAWLSGHECGYRARPAPFGLLPPPSYEHGDHRRYWSTTNPCHCDECKRAYLDHRATTRHDY